MEAPDLAKWVRRQRVARAQSALSEERLQVLYAMGFEFGEVAQLTSDWEVKFDQLIEWLLWQVRQTKLKTEKMWHVRQKKHERKEEKKGKNAAKSDLTGAHG